MNRYAGAPLVLAILVGCSSARGSTFQSTAGDLSIVLHLDSTIVGEPQTVHVDVTRDGHPVTDASVQLAWSMNDMPMSERAVSLEQTTPGNFDLRGYSFSMSGTWHPRITVREPRGEVRTTTYTLEVRD